MVKYALLLIVVFGGFARADGLSDARVRQLIVGSFLFIDNPYAGEKRFNYAKSCCGTDTNRFARLLCEVAQTNSRRMVIEGAIADLGRYGTSAQLPFLYSMTTNAELGAVAMRSVLRLEGLTERSVSAASNFLFRTSIGCRPRYEVCECLLERVQNQGPAHPQRGNSLSLAVGFMATQNIYHDWLDAGLLRADPTFRNSKRRLRALRAIAERETDPRDLSYVANAIAELEAYPEANLPE